MAFFSAIAHVRSKTNVSAEVFCTLHSPAEALLLFQDSTVLITSPYSAQNVGNYIILGYKDLPNVVAKVESGICTISDGNVTLSYPVATADAKNECAFYQEFATAFSDGEFSSFLVTKATVQELTGINTEGSSAAFLYKMASEHNELLTKVLKRLV